MQSVFLRTTGEFIYLFILFKGSLYWHFADKKASNFNSQSSLARAKGAIERYLPPLFFGNKQADKIHFLPVVFSTWCRLWRARSKGLSVSDHLTQGGTVLLFWQDGLVKGTVSICHCGEMIPYTVLSRLYNLKSGTRTDQRCIIKAGFTHSDPVLIFLPLKVAQWSRKNMHSFGYRKIGILII